MSAQLGESMTVGEKLVQIDTKLDTVIRQHGADIAATKTALATTDGKVSALALQQNTHEVKLSQLWEKSLSTFSKSMIWVSTSIAALALARGFIQ